MSTFLSEFKKYINVYLQIQIRNFQFATTNNLYKQISALQKRTDKSIIFPPAALLRHNKLL